MNRFRILILVSGIVLIFGMVLWLTGTLSQFYATVASASLLLANFLLAVVLLLIATLIGALIYYFIRFSQPSTGKAATSPPRPQAPPEKIDAAAENLSAIRQQVAQIQDEIERQALLERSQQIEDGLKRDYLHVVIFGTGSAGKTSIANAILGRVAGEVGAPMGTTTVGTTYRFRFKQVDRAIWITDTPGILEANIIGTEREQQARQLATEADLLLFVVDNDLRQSEQEVLQRLVAMGKRSLLVFNKVDLYTEQDVEALLTQLRQLVADQMEAADVVAIAAQPQTVTLDTGEPVQPQPYLSPLLRRMAAVLRAEGESLLADNILLQSQRLGDEARAIIDSQRRQDAEKIVDRFQWISGSVVSLTPLPGVDMLAAAAINAQMVIELGQVYGCRVNLDHARELAFSLSKTLVGLGVVRGAVELSNLALKVNVGTLIVGQAVQGVSAAYLTRIAGRSFIEYFRRDQTWGDGGMTDVVQQQFQLNRRDEFVKAFIREATERIVTPLKQSIMDRD
ncbi:MAG: GTP-binding protein [Elainellaceae cyanobacterium]